jgi:hypothetical protein
MHVLATILALFVLVFLDVVDDPGSGPGSLVLISASVSIFLIYA